jgi:hypothetical protein
VISSTPNYCNFLPLPQQADVLYDVQNHNYSAGLFEFLLSGSVGSSKSLTLAHLIVDHCLTYPGAAVGIGRLALPRLKETLCQKIKEHLYGTGVEYKYDETKGSFKLPNSSKIIPFSWSDKKYEKFRSYELSAMVFEELSENHDEHKRAYMEAVARVGRLTHVPVAWVGCASNPDSPSHWAYKYFIEQKKRSRKVYYSVTSDNPFLPKSYIENLLEIYDVKMARRMIYGEWLEISDEVIYYTYDRDQNFRDYSYKVLDNHPVCVAFDFNIAIGKPLSIAFIQHVDGQTHIFNQVVIEGLKTREALHEAKERGLLRKGLRYIIHGDASGRHSDTRNNQSDYEIIEMFFMDNDYEFEMDVPRSNPGIKERHNLMNGRICNAKGQRNLFVYKDAPTADEGLRLTTLKKGASYIEDDSKHFQHITTSIGYSVYAQLLEERNSGPDQLIAR